MTHNELGGYVTPEARDLTGDALAIHNGIQAARLGEHEQDDATAQRIASQLHGGQATSLYSLASTGAVAGETLQRELEAAYQEQEDPRVREWIYWLGGYCVRRSTRGPIPGWHETNSEERDSTPPLRPGPAAASTSTWSRSSTFLRIHPGELFTFSLQGTASTMLDRHRTLNAY